ncbi:hypothetical protein B0H14DRAFT_3852333 [Mycena olivaceomarginata]|nr:hypothetical protein B0H14DRAFT_3852333 [Mycena olivaceomarginata]
MLNHYRLRPYIPDHVLLDTEGRLFYGKTPVTPSIDEVLQQRDWATGATLFQDTQSLQTPLVLFMEKIAWDPEARAALSEQHKIDAPQDYVYWVLATRESSLPGEFISSRLRQDNRSAADAVVRLTANWADDLRTLLQGQDPEQTALFHVTSVHPNMKPWTPSRFVTVMGDAVHAMPPTAGSGANTALLDVERLVKTIESCGAVDALTEEAIRQYEDKVHETAADIIPKSFAAGMNSFGQKPIEECNLCKPVKEN